MSSKIITLDDHRPRIVIECDNGDRYCYTEAHMARVAAGRSDLDTISPDALRSIIGQWLFFVDHIADFADDEPDE